MFKLYVFVLVPQLISDKSTAKGKLTEESVYYIEQECLVKPLIFHVVTQGEKKEKKNMKKWLNTKV